MLKTLLTMNASTIAKNLLDFQKSEILQATNHVFEMTNQALDELDDKYQRTPIYLESFLKELSPIIDKKILYHAEVSDLKPIGGKLHLKKNTDNQDIIIYWEFYFLDKEQKFQKIESQKIFHKAIFVEDDYKKIVNGLTFNIDKPNFEV